MEMTCSDCGAMIPVGEAHCSMCNAAMVCSEEKCSCACGNDIMQDEIKCDMCLGSGDADEDEV